MSSRTDATVPSARRPRKSTGHSPVRKRMDKENITVDVASSLAGNGGRKRSRSKSIGPGGLDGLKPGFGNRRVSLAAPAKPPPKSILKPTMPLLPEIPSYKSKQPARNSPPTLTMQGTDKLPNPFQNDDSTSSGTKVALRTEEEQQAAAREREERERALMEKEINDRREARRKSLANRRVSFAAEATLHTFHEIEYMQDSTTSTDSTRRASSLAAQSPAPAPPAPEASDPPSTPPEQVEDIIPGSPEDQRNLHQKKRRRSSGASSLNFNNPIDDTMASSVFSSDSDATDGVMEAHEEIGSDSGSDSDADGVSMDLDVDEITGTSVASALSARSAFTDDSNNTLDTALRLASRQAETQNLDDEEIIPSFGWGRRSAPKRAPLAQDQENMPISSTAKTSRDDEQEETSDMDMDMEMTSAVGGIIRSQDDSQDDVQEEEMSMDVTRVLGGILTHHSNTQNMQSANSGANDDSGDGSSAEDAPMDFTMAVGGIRENPASRNQLFDHDDIEEDEDMSMELTSAMGGVLSSNRPDAVTRTVLQGRRRPVLGGSDESAMEMTVGLGRILATDEEDENEEDATMGMDMTMAMGGIIKGPPATKSRLEAMQLMEQEVNEDDGVPALKSSSKRRLSAAIAGTGTSETGSPGIPAFRGQGLRRSNDRRKSVTPRSSSPVRDVSTLKSMKATRPSSPNKRGPRTPLKDSPSRKPKSPSASNAHRSSDLSVSTPQSASMNVFQQDPSNGVPTPRVTLTPQGRRLSGVGADRSGLGSPKVAAIFERRGSIGDAADNFVPHQIARSVSFADPRIIESQVDHERQQEADKENGRRILEREVDGGDEENTTASLKDMISSMTPKKKPLKGRKSLHVGSAKGLLGKRPAELDDDEAEEMDGVKRLKNHQSSPVKNVRLHAPPSKAETTGRMTRSATKNQEGAGGNGAASTPIISPKKTPAMALSPRGKGRFKDVESSHPASTINFDEPHVIADSEVQVDDDGERIHLQDFLNMTNIRFMELTTTKRRHTQAPGTMKDDATLGKEDMSLEKCVVAGACTVPMLELYQHSCRELKKYISEGRRIVREIETETLEENPPLFKEYITATPEYKLFMDNQFKNVKTHARLLSKAMWYEWRMKLQDGLKEGLLKIEEGMAADDQLLHKEQELLDSILPKLIDKFECLQIEHDNLQSEAEEMAECDPEDLQAARAELTEVDADIQAKLQKIEQLRQQLGETETGISDLSQKKKECIADIEKAEKVREEYRGWTSNDVSFHKANCEKIEKEHGWAVTGAKNGTTKIRLAYRREIELLFDVSPFKGLAPNAPIDLQYIAANRERDPKPSSPEKEFFIQCIRDHVRGLVQAETKIKDFLHMVSSAWKKANHVAFNIRLLNTTFKIVVAKTSDSSMAIRVPVRIRSLSTKVEIVLNLHGQSIPGGVDFTIVPEARVVYGEQFKAENLVEYLKNRIGPRVVTKEEQGDVEYWVDAVLGLQEKLTKSKN